MTRHNVPLGKILGIPIGLDYSWFVIFALLTWMLAHSYFPGEFKALERATTQRSIKCHPNDARGDIPRKAMKATLVEFLRSG
jgi:hypothetical protein